MGAVIVAQIIMGVVGMLLFTFIMGRALSPSPRASSAYTGSVADQYEAAADNLEAMAEATNGAQ